MKVIIGLGNPGKKYEGTRHNIGFIITSEISSKYGINGKLETKFNSIIGKGSINGNDVFVIQPLTFMNLSGQAVASILNWYKISPSEIIVIYDDISLDMGRIRFRAKGSDGGHNGIKSIISSLGGFKDFPRLKIGIGPDPGGEARASFVLQKFSPQERDILNKLIPICTEAIEIFIKEGIDSASNKFNAISV